MLSPNTTYTWKPLSQYESSTQKPFEVLSSIRTLSNEPFVAEENKPKIQLMIDLLKKDLSAIFFPHRKNNLQSAVVFPHRKNNLQTVTGEFLSKASRLKELFELRTLEPIREIPKVTELFKNFTALEKSITSSLSKTHKLLPVMLPTLTKTENSQKNLKHFANWIQETISNVLSSFAFCSTPPLHWQVFASNVIYESNRFAFQAHADFLNQFLTNQAVKLYKKSFARAVRTFAFTESFDGEILRNIDFLTKRTLQPEKKSGKRDSTTAATLQPKKKQNKSLKKRKTLFRQKIFAIYLESLNDLTPLEKGFSQLEISPFIYTQEIKANHISPIIQKYFRTITKSIYIFEKNPIEYPFFIGKNKLLFYLLPDILKKLPLKEKDQKDLKNLEKLSAISNDPYFLESYQAVRSKSSVEIFTKFKEKLSELPRQMKSGKKRAQEIFNYVMHSNSVIETWEKTSTISSIACFILLQESPPILDLLHMMYLVYQTPLDANVLKLKTLEKTLQKKFPDQTENIALLSSKAHFLEMFELFALETLSRLENPLPFSKLPTLLEGKMNVEDLKEAKTGWRKSIKQNPLFDIWMKDSTDRKTYQQVLDAERDHLKKSSNSITNILPGD